MGSLDDLKCRGDHSFDRCLAGLNQPWLASWDVKTGV